MNGKSTVTVDGEKVKAEAITAFYFPPGSNYRLINDSKDDATWIFIGAPVDEYVDDKKYKWGARASPMSGSWKDSLRVFLQKSSSASALQNSFRNA